MSVQSGYSGNTTCNLLQQTKSKSRLKHWNWMLYKVRGLFVHKTRDGLPGSNQGLFMVKPRSAMLFALFGYIHPCLLVTSSFGIIITLGERGLPGPTGPTAGGVVYTRWGRTTCPTTSGTQLVYAGKAAGSFYHESGGAAD